VELLESILNENWPNCIVAESDRWMEQSNGVLSQGVTSGRSYL
jgi:hypothetical protein